MRIWLAFSLTLVALSGLLEGSLRVVLTDRVKPFVRLLDSFTVLSLVLWSITALWRWALYVS
jgi:hypothetical protein